MKHLEDLLDSAGLVAFRLKFETSDALTFIELSQNAREILGLAVDVPQNSFASFLAQFSANEASLFQHICREARVDLQRKAFELYSFKIGEATSPMAIRLRAVESSDSPATIEGIFAILPPGRTQESKPDEAKVLRDVLVNIPHSVFWKDRNSVYLGCNERFLKDANLKSIEDVVGKTDFDMPWGQTDAAGYRKYDAELMSSGKSILNIEETQLQADGRKVHVVTSKVPLRGPNQEVVGILGIYMDVSELRTAQENLANQQKLFFDYSKMAALGQMAAGIAHEINTPLAIISTLAYTNIQALEKGKPVASEHLIKQFDQIDNTVERIAKIVKGLRVFSRNEVPDKKESAHIGALVSDTLQICSDKLKVLGVRLDLSGVTENCEAPCRATEISQVLLNLVGNACDAVQDLDEKWIRISISKHNELVKITVTDSGTGISESLAQKIFEPFFTSKEVGKGTGLGLSVSMGIMKAHHGDLIYNSASPNTQFELTLPLAG